MHDGDTHRPLDGGPGAGGAATRHELRARFQRALDAAGATADGGALFAELCARLGEPGRHYHTLAHVEACLAWLDWFCASARRPAEVELALWLHDAVYDPRRSDNEAQSAELAAARLRALGVSEVACDRVGAYILATAEHEAAAGDAALTVDLDLSILGASPAAYDRFEEQIRAEYAHVPSPFYRRGRRRVLEGFASRSRIYQVPVIRAELEPRARANLERALAALGSRRG